jgi:hypothetical protein
MWRSEASLGDVCTSGCDLCGLRFIIHLCLRDFFIVCKLLPVVQPVLLLYV